MRTKNMPPEAPKSWVRRGIDSVKEGRLATRVVGAVALAAVSLGIGSGVGEAAGNFNEAHRETTCQEFTINMEASQNGVFTVFQPDGESAAAVQNFLDTQPGGYELEQIFPPNVAGVDEYIDKHTDEHTGEQKVQVCVSDAPFSGSRMAVSSVESVDAKSASSF